MTGAAVTHPIETETPDLEITLPARAENVAVVRHAVGGLGEVLEVDDQMLSDIKLAVTEACTNVVVHAYPQAEGPMGLAESLELGTGEGEETEVRMTFDLGAPAAVPGGLR
jgi:anti-sigma regulatory factor (Ser/Thr protein kinase)